MLNFWPSGGLDATPNLRDETRVGSYTLTLVDENYEFVLTSKGKKYSLHWTAGLMTYYLMKTPGVHSYASLKDAFDKHSNVKRGSLHGFRSYLNSLYNQINRKGKDCLSATLIAKVKGQGHHFISQVEVENDEKEVFGRFFFDSLNLQLYCKAQGDMRKLEIGDLSYYLLYHIVKTLSIHPKFLFSDASLRKFSLAKSTSNGSSWVIYHLKLIRDALQECEQSFAWSEVGRLGFFIHIAGLNDEILKPELGFAGQPKYWPFQKNIFHEDQVFHVANQASLYWYYLFPSSVKSHMNAFAFERLFGSIPSHQRFKKVFRSGGTADLSEPILSKENKEKLFWLLSSWFNKGVSKLPSSYRYSDQEERMREVENTRLRANFYASSHLCPLVFPNPELPEARFSIPSLGFVSEDLSLSTLIAFLASVSNRWVQVSEQEQILLRGFRARVLKAAKAIDDKKQRLKAIYLIELEHDMARLSI